MDKIGSFRVSHRSQLLVEFMIMNSMLVKDVAVNLALSFCCHSHGYLGHFLGTSVNKYSPIFFELTQHYTHKNVHL